jgi:hypothetical protein
MIAKTPWGGHDHAILVDIVTTMSQVVATRFFIVGSDFELCLHPGDSAIATAVDVWPSIGARELKTLVVERCADHQSKLDEEAAQ